MFEKMRDYIKYSREERRKHLDLKEDCIEIGGYDSREYRGLLAHFLKTEIPTHENIKIMLCHACNNSKCSNVKHLYWGTTKDNTIDSKEFGTWKNLFERSKEKYGERKALEIQRKNASKGGKGNKGKKKITLEQEKLYLDTIKKYFPLNRGDISKLAKELNLSHTQIGRILKQHNLGM
jgi:hypothetical protein